MKKKIYGLLIMMLVLLLPVIANAASSGTCGANGSNLTWTLDNGTLIISGSGKMKDYSKPADSPFCEGTLIKQIIINKGVKSIGENAFSLCKNVTSVTISNTVTSIGDNAFDNCTSLTSITIPDSVTSIGASAFWNCKSLSSITIGNGLTSVGEGAFTYCNNIKNVYITDLAAWCNISFSTAMSQPICLCSDIYVNNEIVTDLVIPDGVTSIGKYAFDQCTSLKSVTIPDSVTSIGAIAFRNCTSLTSATLGDGVRSIGEKVFEGCTGLASVTLGNGVRSIGESAFEGCTGLNEVTIPKNVTSIGARAFYGSIITLNYNAISCQSIGSNSYSAFGSSIKTLNIGENVESIPENAFWSCNSLTSVTIPKNITSIGKWAFRGCAKLVNVNYDVRYCYNYGGSAFEGCTALENVNIGDGVENFSAGLFSNCISITTVHYNAKNCSISYGSSVFSGTSLKNLYIGDNVQVIPANIFSTCDNLTEVTIPNNVISIGNSAFKDCTGLTNITIPNNVTSIGSSTFEGCTGLTDVTIPNNITSIGSSTFSGCSGLTNVTIPDNVTSIGNHAFDGCSGLTSVTIPSSVKSIGTDAFYGCNNLNKVNITDIAEWCSTSFDNSYSNPLNCAKKIYLNDEIVMDIIIPDNITDISAYAFYNCSGLTSVTIPSSVKSIGTDAFYGCNNLNKVNITDISEWCSTSFDNSYSNPLNCAKKIYLNDEIVMDIIIPDNITDISAYAFYNCSGLTSITIPSGVKSIGTDAFYGCNNLNKVNITDISEWCSTSFDNSYSNPLYYAKNLYINDEIISDIAIPNSVTNISDYAFCNCNNAVNIVIPNSVNSIDNDAFYNCDKLENITFNGTRQNWNAIFEGTLSKKTIVHTIENIEDMTIEEILPMVYNGEGLTPEPIVKDGSVILVQSQDYNISYENNITVGTAYVTITGTEEENSQTHAKYTGSKTISFSIEKANATFVTEPTAKTNLIYDGTEQQLLTLGESEVGIIQYSFEENSGFSDNVPVATDAGIYTVYYKILGDDNYNDSETYNISVSILKAEAGITSPTPTEGLIYSGSEQEIINPGSSDNGVIQYSFEENNNFSTNIPTATNAGTYTIYYKVIGDKNHNDGEVYAITTKIAKAESYLLAPAVKENIVYNSNPQELVSAGTAEGGTMQYSFKENSGFSEEIIKATNAGEYVVYYKVMGDKNHNDSDIGSLKITIEKALPDVQTPNKLTAFIGQFLSEVELPSNWKWITPEMPLNTVGSHTFKAEYIPTDTDNYNTVIDNISVEVQNTPLPTSKPTTKPIPTPTTVPTTKPAVTPDVPQETDTPQKTECPAETEEPIIIPETMPFEIQNAAVNDKVTADIVNISDTAQSGIVIFAAYTHDGKLVSVKCQNIDNIAASDTLPCEFDIPEGAEKYRLLAWNSWKYIIPLAESVEVK